MTTLETSAQSLTEGLNQEEPWRPRRRHEVNPWERRLAYRGYDYHSPHEYMREFRAREHFQVGHGIDRFSPWGVTRVSDRFNEYFTAGDGLVEERPSLSTAIDTRDSALLRLSRPRNARDILRCVCEVCVTPINLLQSVYSFVFPTSSMFANEERGDLYKFRRHKTDAGMPHRDVCFVEDQRGVCRLVCMYQYRGGVAFEAFPIFSDNVFWPIGTRILVSRSWSPSGVL
jgi:hypothetical protein